MPADCINNLIIVRQDLRRFAAGTYFQTVMQWLFETINTAKAYNINHLQLSHRLVMDLREIRDPERNNLVNELISKAHDAGIKEVVVWDHALYDLNYYPGQFKTGPGNNQSW